MTWVQKGGIHRWVGEQPPDAGDEPAAAVTTERRVRVSQRTGFCIDCRADIEKRSVRCWACYKAHIEEHRPPPKESPISAIDDVMRRLSRNLGKPIDMGVTCHCGCLLAHANETCPNCLAWAMADEIKWSWRAAA